MLTHLPLQVAVVVLEATLDKPARNVLAKVAQLADPLDHQGANGVLQRVRIQRHRLRLYVLVPLHLGQYVVTHLAQQGVKLCAVLGL